MVVKQLILLYLHFLYGMVFEQSRDSNNFNCDLIACTTLACFSSFYQSTTVYGVPEFLMFSLNF